MSLPGQHLGKGMGINITGEEMQGQAIEEPRAIAGRILIVDDDPSIRELSTKLFEKSYEVRTAADGFEAIALAASWAPDLVLLDIQMPGLTGYETCARLKQMSFLQKPQIIMVSSKSTLEEQSAALESGADDFLAKPVTAADLISRVTLHFRLRNSLTHAAWLQSQVASQKQAVEQQAQDRLAMILAVQDITVLALAKVAESRDQETGEHLVRMRDYACRIAQRLANHPDFGTTIDGEFTANLFRSAPLHDIGKVGIPDSILLKPGKLTEAEFELMKRHTTIGAAILDDLVLQSRDAGFLAMAAKIARFHHERWDGKGYPAGLEGEEIPLAARIVSVADVYDALTCSRPYKDAWPSEKAISTIVDGADTRFDARIVDALIDVHADLLRIQQNYAKKEPLIRGAMAFLEYDINECVS